MAIGNAAYPTPPYGGYPSGYGYGYPSTGYPGYGYPPTGYPPQGYGNDAYSQGYQSAYNNTTNGAAGQVSNFGNTLTNTSVNVFGTMNSVVGTTANVLGSVANLATSVFGGFGNTTGYGYGYGQPGYVQPGYGQPQPGQAYGPPWGPDMQQAQQQVWSRISTASRAGQIDDIIEEYGDQAQNARKAMQLSMDQANAAIQELQSAVSRLQQQGGPNSPQGQALLAEIASIKDRAMTALGNVDKQARTVYVAAFSAQNAFGMGAQRFPNLNQSACARELSRAWSFYNGAPTERLHWYSLSKSPVTNAVQMQNQARQQVTAALSNLDQMLRQAVTTPMPTTTPTSF